MPSRSDACSFDRSCIELAASCVLQVCASAELIDNMSSGKVAYKSDPQLEAAFDRLGCADQVCRLQCRSGKKPVPSMRLRIVTVTHIGEGFRA
jgi:hypothetical protein